MCRTVERSEKQIRRIVTHIEDHPKTEYARVKRKLQTVTEIETDAGTIVWETETKCQ